MQFEVMRKKLHILVTKLMRTEINPFQAAIYYNAYMIKSVYFRCGIIEFNAAQETELKRLYEEPLLVKLGLSRKFPRVVLYSRKSALGVGIMMPNTILAILKAKLYIGNIRIKKETYNDIKLHEELMIVEAGREVKVGEGLNIQYWELTWIDEVNKVFSSREIRLHNEKNKLIMTNKTLMEYAVQYISSMGRKEEELYQINFVRLKKQVYLPFELVGKNGRSPTTPYYNLEEISQVLWKFLQPITEEINNKQKRIWERFMRWLSIQQVQTVEDFEIKIWRWK